MRLRGGFGRAGTLAGVLAFALALAACSGQGGPPKEYELGAAAAATPGGVEDFAANAGDVVYFAGDSTTLSPTAQATLRKQVRWLNRHPGYRVTIEGHADEWGTRQHNLTLGAQRATAVETFLKKNGLRVDRVHTVSYGKERLVADCTAISCRSQNRRAQTVLSASTAAR
jgi:peptidoglycan-associated lipoprotein